MLNNRSSFPLILLITLLIAIPATAFAEELRNDGWENGGSLSFQGGFISGEIGAVRLVPSVPGSWPLQNVQLMFGGASSVESIVLHIWDDSAGSNNPGSELYSETYQIQGSGEFMSEIDLSGEGITVSGPIRVGIEFTQNGYPSIARDDDGSIDAARNFIYSGGAWYQSSLFGLTGDWIIRANTNSTAGFTVGGIVSGLSGSMTLQNNGGDDLVVTSNGPFTFATALENGDSYNVTVLSEPAGQTCVVGNGSGSINGASVTDVSITCSGGSSVLQNDTFVDGDEAAYQGGFVSGEIAASRLTTPGLGSWSLEMVELLFGGATSQQIVTLKVWDDIAGTDAPGVELYSADYVLTGGDFLQQIDLTGAGLMVSGDIRVGFQFQHDGYPSVARDNDGITPDKNFIYISAGTWHEAGILGVTGDWIIRATVSQQQPQLPFEITSIQDLPNDQGRQVRITWPNNQHDSPGDPTPVTGYAIFRRIEPDMKTYPPGDWDYLVTVPAFQETIYSTIVATVADSTIVDGMFYSTFFVRAMTASPGTFFDSAPDSGYSVDNLAPGVPTSIMAVYEAGGVTLDWDDAPEADFHYYRIHRGTDPGFVPSAGNLVQEVFVSAWSDPSSDPWSFFYKIVAVDHAGNKSPAGSPTNLTGVQGSGIPTRTALLGAMPNPFNPSTTLVFEMATAGPMRLEVYDVGGRLVATLANEYRPAGRHELVWDGKDSVGRTSSAGVYLYRLNAGRFSETKRMVLVK